MRRSGQAGSGGLVRRQARELQRRDFGQERPLGAADFVANNSPERCVKQREYLEANLAQIVPRAQAEAVLTTMKAACSAKPSRNQSGVIIGRLIDSFPNARPHSAVTYRENLVHLCEVDG